MDPFPIKNGDIPLLCWFTRGYYWASDILSGKILTFPTPMDSLQLDVSRSLRTSHRWISRPCRWWTSEQEARASVWDTEKGIFFKIYWDSKVPGDGYIFLGFTLEGHIFVANIHWTCWKSTLWGCRLVRCSWWKMPAFVFLRGMLAKSQRGNEIRKQW